MRARVLTVLMWKHGAVRIRKFINTAVDLVSPIMFFLLIFAIRTSINPPPPNVFTNVQANTEEIQIDGGVIEYPRQILYHPDTPLAASLMAEVALKLQNLTRLTKFPDVGDQGYYAYTDDDQLVNFTTRLKRQEGAVIIFHDLKGEDFPDRLNYTIRMKENFYTDTYETRDSAPGPHQMFGIDYHEFMRLQWAVDSSFIKKKLKDDVNTTLYLQEFPYYHTPKNAFIQMICSVLSALCWASLLLNFVFLMCRLVDERTSGVQELMKMVGVPLNVLGFSHVLNVLPCGLMFAIGGTITVKVSDTPILEHCNGFLIFLMLILYFNSVIALACAASYLIKTSEFAVTVSVVTYGFSFMPVNVVDEQSLPYVVRLLTGFLPHTPMYWFWKEVSIFEMYGSGVNFSNMFRAAHKDNGSVFLVFVFLLIQGVLYYTLAWYLSYVRPGKYGQALPWDFIFKGEFWDKNATKTQRPSESDTIELMNRETGQYFEQPPDHLQVGIRVENVSKMYPKHKALKQVSMKAYQGEITVLVGHNGAGKTTLMSIITGMTSATEGKVYVKELDTVTQRDEVRKHIGLCPQHNMFFTDLTLQQHIMFFTMLKRGTYREAVESSQKLAASLGLEHEKLGQLCSALSGGMKRRAQLACALAGNADVLVLDEPTSGLDVQTRRELWNLLLSLRGSRTVLLSTHFMEEADALGDRVVALHQGELRCFATTMHLKKAVGNGYRLSLTTIGLPNEPAITQTVLAHVSGATIKEKTINSIAYNLPASANDQFPELFTSLENKRSELGIDSIGVGVSTLEEVFLKLCSDTDMSAIENGVDGVTPVPTQERLTGLHLYWRQLIILLKRQMRYALYRKWVFLIFQIIIPITVIFLITNTMNNFYIGDKPLPELRLDLSMYSDVSDRRLLYNLQADDAATFRTLNQEYSGFSLEPTDNVANRILEIGKKDVLEYNKYIAGVELNDTSAKVLFTTTIRHAAPVALNMLSNLLGMRHLRWPEPRISTNNHPVEGYVRHTEQAKQPKEAYIAILWAVFITFFTQATSFHCVSLPCRERLSGARHIHVMSGCPAALHWAATLLFHMALTVLFIIVPAIIAVLTLDMDSTFDQPEFLLSFSMIMVTGTLASFAFMYLVSFGYKETSTNIVLIAMLFIFGLVLPIVKSAHALFETSANRGPMYYFLEFCSYISPQYTFITSMFRAVTVARLNQWCVLTRKYCPRIFVNEVGFDAGAQARCCAGEQARSYFNTDDFSPQPGVYILIAQFIVIMTMVVMTQRGVFNSFFDWIRNLRYQPQEADNLDATVRAERVYVQQEITKPAYSINQDSLLVSEVHKNYASLFRKDCNAVRGVSFSVKKGECFGLLGVNGAGKSTTFKMLTAEECVTRGQIFGNGHHLKKDNSQYLQTLGYCPQFFGLDMFQTGEQNLEMVLTLRGLDQHQVKEEVQAWIDVVGLREYARRPADSYSGGCVRRLGAAAALCSGAALTLLDEPSAGVDVAARRRLWAALRKALKQQRSIVITSHR
ncbi:phospholipid-transporting ATPase ABCA3-like isoform X2 [Anticarsia gemmatalis]|uniref:phospholipid-transporting ATPase ABCA3-like isoform X2 n=1 Tax=Anticarsia gemmatalis TaxID=129554 RepID=UPI003F76F8F3